MDSGLVLTGFVSLAASGGILNSAGAASFGGVWGCCALSAEPKTNSARRIGPLLFNTTTSFKRSSVENGICIVRLPGMRAKCIASDEYGAQVRPHDKRKFAFAILPA